MSIVYENPAAEYFEEAVRALLDADRYPSVGASDAIAQLERRLRVASLFAAFSCEAYANAFLAFALDSRTASSLDRITTVRKYVEGPEALGEAPALNPGAAPLQTIAALFSERNRIVHARPERVSRTAHGLRMDPRECTVRLIAVADCVYELSQALNASDFMGPLELMNALGDEIDLDIDMIDTERTYFFTGGLVHAVRETRSSLAEFATRLQLDPTAKPPAACETLLARGRERESALREHLADPRPAS